jgi:hypothetical protein
MPSRPRLSSTASRIISTTEGGSKGASKTANTWARSARMSSSGAASGVSSTTLTRGRISRISSRSARSSSTAVARSVTTTSYECRRSRRKACALPWAWSTLASESDGSARSQRSAWVVAPISRTLGGMAMLES